MTTIAAIQGKNWVVIGSDTQSTINDYKRIKMAGEKVYENNGLLIAGAGQGRGLDLLHKGWTAPKPPKTCKTPEQLDKWMVKTFIPKMRDLFISAGYDMKDDGEYAQHESVFLIAVNGIVYYVDDDYSIDRDVRGFMAFGTGGDFATGALTVLDDKHKSVTSASEAVIRAVQAAIQHDVYSGGDIKVYVQKSRGN